MPIYVELTVPPHYGATKFVGVNRVGGELPHVALRRRFDTWDETHRWVETLGMYVSPELHTLLTENLENEYVQVELDMTEVTGGQYIAACLSVEGKEGDWPGAPAE